MLCRSWIRIYFLNNGTHDTGTHERDQSIYKCFLPITEALLSAVRVDVRNLSDESTSMASSNRIDKFSTIQIKTSKLKFYTIAVLLAFFSSHADATVPYSSQIAKVSSADAPEVYLDNSTVFLGTNSIMDLKPILVADAISLFDVYRDNHLVYIDEIPIYESENFCSCLFLRNLLRTLKLLCVLSGTESTLMNMVGSVSGSSRGEITPTPWVTLFVNLPKTADALITRHWDSFQSLNAYGQHILKQTRPLFVEWYFAAANIHCKGNAALTPALLSGMKSVMLGGKSSMRSVDGVQAQIAMLFADSLTDEPKGGSKRSCVNSSNSCPRTSMIRHNFAYLVAPVKQTSDPEGMCLLNLIAGELYDGIGKYEARAVFRPCLQDELLYLVCLRDGVWGNSNDGKPINLASTFAFTIFRKNTAFQNRNSTSNPGKLQEEEVVAAVVLASHRGNSFDGQDLLPFLANMLGELSPVANFSHTEFTNVPDSLLDHLALLNIKVPLLSPPNMTWQSTENTEWSVSNLNWCRNAEMMDIRMNHVMFEVKDEEKGTNFGVVSDCCGKLVSSTCTVCIMVAAKFTKFRSTSRLDPRVAVYRINALDTIELERDADVPNTETKKVMLLVDLEKLYPTRAGIVQHLR